jgi:hypothetical protein
MELKKSGQTQEHQSGLNGLHPLACPPGVHSVLVKEMFRPAELVERIRRLVPTWRWLRAYSASSLQRSASVLAARFSCDIQ